MQPVSTYCFPASSRRPASAQSPYSPGRKAVGRNRLSSAAPASQPLRPRTPQLWQHLTETQIQVPKAASPGAKDIKGILAQPAVLHGSSPTDSPEGGDTADSASVKARAVSSKPARPQSAWRAAKRPVSSTASRQAGTVSTSASRQEITVSSQASGHEGTFTSEASKQEGSPQKQAEQQEPSASAAAGAMSAEEGERKMPVASALSRAAGLNGTTASPSNADNAAVQPATASPDLAAVGTGAAAGK